MSKHEIALFKTQNKKLCSKLSYLTPYYLYDILLSTIKHLRKNDNTIPKKMFKYTISKNKNQFPDWDHMKPELDLNFC